MIIYNMHSTGYIIYTHVHVYIDHLAGAYY